MALHHYFEVFCPETAEVNARCATRLEAEKSAIVYSERDGRDYLIYECRVVAEVGHDRPTPGSKEKS